MGDNDERRIHHRFRLWLPARLEGAQHAIRLAVGHDMSQKGSLLVTTNELAVGDRVRLFVRIPPEGEREIAVSAHVLRVQANDADPHGLWPYRVALEFDEAVPELEHMLRDRCECLQGLMDTGEQRR